MNVLNEQQCKRAVEVMNEYLSAPRGPDGKTPVQIEAECDKNRVKIIETELKRFAGDLNLSDQQKTQLRSVLEKASERLDAVREKNPDITRADVIAKLGEVRGSLREHVVKFLTPEQLTKWDAEVAKGKTFLGATVKA